MFAEVEFLYQNGVLTKPYRRLVGRLHSDSYKGTEQLHIWHVDWCESGHASHPTPLATMWSPTIGYVRGTMLLFHGYECVKRGSTRAWVVQKWICATTDRKGALEQIEYFRKNPALPVVRAQ